MVTEPLSRNSDATARLRQWALGGEPMVRANARLDAFLRAGAADTCDGDVYNVGGDAPISHRALAQLLVSVAGRGSVSFVEWPADKKRIDIGSFYSDSQKFRKATGWAPRVPLEEGIRRTLQFYREHLPAYVQDGVAAQATP